MSAGNRVSKPGVMKTRRNDGMTSGFVSKLIFSVFYNVLFFGGMLFLPAGTFDWPRAWAFLCVLIVATIATMIIVFPGREDLLNERFKPPVQKGQPLADKIIGQQERPAPLVKVAELTNLAGLVGAADLARQR